MEIISWLIAMVVRHWVDGPTPVEFVKLVQGGLWET